MCGSRGPKAQEKAKRVEARFPDPSGKPLPGLRGAPDGWPRRASRTRSIRARLPDRTSTICRPEELAEIPTVCSSLREALEALEADHDFLLAGDVFTKDQLEGYMALKWEEVYAYEHAAPSRVPAHYSC
ncbi:MAG: hypothetical protein R3D84_13360 [Paracoccaceae bacterium]